MGNGITYRDAGVDIDAGNALVEAIKPLAKATARAGADAGLGGFGAFFDPKRAGFRDPILVATTDGVGTKLKIAIEAGCHDTIGIDLVAMCVNDLVVQGAQGRHREVSDAVEVLAAFGGFETAVMVGAMLVAASKRHLIMVDGMAACAALMVASRIAESVVDYCVFCRSRTHQGLDRALGLFQASALLELGLDTTDGTGACLSWPLVDSAAALLSELGDDDEGSQPAGIDPPVIQSLYDPNNPTVPGLP